MLRFRHILLACLAWLALATSGQAECAKWDINGEWEVAQSDGLDTTFQLRQDGDQLTGAASYKSLTGGNSRGTSQSLEGTFDQYGNLRIAVKWDSGAVVVYAGGINGEGRFAGVVKDESNLGNSASWHQMSHDGRNIPVTCLAEATPPLLEAPSSPPASEIDKLGDNNGPGVGAILAPSLGQSPTSPAGFSKTAIVIADVDVYRAPGGAGEPIGVLRSDNMGTKVSIVTPCQDNWCHVKGDPVPTGEGWVYSGTPPDFQSLQF